MGGAGTECDSDRARASRATLQSWRVIVFKRVRYQYVGHCSKHGSRTVISIIAFGNITIPCCQTLWQRFQASAQRGKRL